MKRVMGAVLLIILERVVSRFFHLDLFQWIFAQTILFALIPLAVIFALNLNRAEFGLKTHNYKKEIKYGLGLVLLATPFMIYGAMLQSFKAYYPIWAPARTSTQNLIFLELVILVMMFNTEFIFRGALLFSLERFLRDKKNGVWIAILLHSIIYMLVHVGKPFLEVPYSFFVGIVFGWLTLKTRSILPSVVAHWTSSVVFDIMVLTL